MLVSISSSVGQRKGLLALIGKRDNLSQVFFEYLQRSQLFLLVLHNWLRRDQFLWHPARDQDIIFFRDLHPTLFGVELAYSNAIPHLLQVELLGLVASKFDHVQPRNGSVFSMRFQYAWRTIEEALETTDEDWADRASAKVACNAFVAMDDALVIRDKA